MKRGILFYNYNNCYMLLSVLVGGGKEGAVVVGGVFAKKGRILLLDTPISFRLVAIMLHIFSSKAWQCDRVLRDSEGTGWLCCPPGDQLDCSLLKVNI